MAAPAAVRVRPYGARRILRQLGIGCASFTAVAVIFTGQVWLDYAYAGRRLTWLQALGVALVEWEPWGLLSPAVVWLARRWPFSARRWRGPVVVHAACAVAIGVPKLILESAIGATLGPGGPRPTSFLKIYLTLLTYWAIVAAVDVADYMRAANARELRASQLEAELARAQVEALKMQLHPHFLFNTLNTIAGLMREDVEAADLMIARLAELLRRTFESEGVQEVTLERELQVLETYLAIQQVRHGDRLRVSIAASADARRGLVPNLILQPLVENAIRHGVAARPGPGAVAIDGRVDGDRLVVEVVNDGPAFAAGVRDGYGLRNTRSRLTALYGSQAHFTLTGREPGGAVVRVTLPWHAGDAR